MSHQSGIQPSPQLLDQFKQLRKDQIHSLQITLTDDQALVKQSTVHNPSIVEAVTWRKVKEYLNEPCFVLLHFLDTKSSPQQPLDGFVFLSFVPSDAPVRQKMLYASTRTSLVQHLTQILPPNQLLLNAQLHSKEELTKDWLLQEIKLANGKDPALQEKLREDVMDERERMVKEMQLRSARQEFGTQRRKSHASALQFSWTPQAQTELQSQYPANTSVLCFSIVKEEVHLAPLAPHKFPPSLNPDELLKKLKEAIPSGEPRYILVNYPSSGTTGTDVFIYTCPPSSSVQQKMIYASARSPFVAQLNELLKGIGRQQECKRLEVSDVQSDLTKELFAGACGSGQQSGGGAGSRPNLSGDGSNKNDGENGGGWDVDEAVKQHGFVKKIAPPGARRLIPASARPGAADSSA